MSIFDSPSKQTAKVNPAGVSPASLSEQLARLRRTRFAQVPRVRFVMQAFLGSSIHTEENRATARNRVLDWARAKWPGLVPAHAYEGKPFEYNQAGLQIGATTTVDRTVWTFRSEHLDSQHSRTWVTEALVADLGPHDAMGARNLCSSLADAGPPTSSPSFLRDFVTHHSLTDAGLRVTATPHAITSSEEVETCVRLLTASDRHLPIVMISQLPGRPDYAVDARKLAKAVPALAHVFCVSTPMTFILSERLGKPLSVFQGAVRTYYPGFSVESDPWKHHLVLAQRIADWTDERGAGPTAFQQFLAEQLHLFSVANPERIDDFPSYFSIRRTVLDTPNKTAQDEVELLRMELDDVRTNQQEWETLARDRDAEAERADDENHRLRAQNLSLAGEVRRLRQSRGEATTRIPESYEELADWLNLYYADRLVLHGRATRALKTAQFTKVALVYKSLMLLGDSYWAMRTNTDPECYAQLKSRWESELGALGLEYDARSISESRLGEFREQYTVDWKISQTTKQVLGPHLKYGSTKDDRFCMRIYFFWDDEQQLVVVGHLPSHLDTRAS